MVPLRLTQAIDRAHEMTRIRWREAMLGDLLEDALDNIERATARVPDGDPGRTCCLDMLEGERALARELDLLDAALRSPRRRPLAAEVAARGEALYLAAMELSAVAANAMRRSAEEGVTATATGALCFAAAGVSLAAWALGIDPRQAFEVWDTILLDGAGSLESVASDPPGPHDREA